MASHRFASLSTISSTMLIFYKAPTGVVSQLSDGQPQAPTGVVSQLSDGQPQAPTGVVSQLSDGQPQAPTGAPVSQ